MEPFFIHLLKSSSILLLFLLSYYLFLRKETFFNGNRVFLLSGLLIALLLPFITITKTIIAEPPSTQIASSIESSFYVVDETIASEAVYSSFNWQLFIFVIYLLGVIYFAVKLILQLQGIKRIKKQSTIVEDNTVYHVKTKKQISPFSFFKHIFYFPKQFKDTELNIIIAHEKVHAQELHSLDILLTEFLFIILWFNPIIWLYKIIIKQNLEFLADAKSCNLNQDKKFYQYLMLRQAVGHHQISIANPFYNSIIKKRIVMLNQKQSKSVNRLKLLFVLPFLGLFLFGFNTKEVVKFSEVPSPQIFEYEQAPSFVSPLKQEDIERVTFGFGETNTAVGVKFHNGIDLVGRTGKNVMASADGIVKIATQNEENGNYIVIDHSDGYSTKYLHLKDRNVSNGQQVKAGEFIGHVGNTGKSTGPHLHFEILKENMPVNPEKFIPFKIDGKKAKDAKKDIDVIIKKNTSNEALEKIKQDLAAQDVDFSYIVVRNDKGEIIDIELNANGRDASEVDFDMSYNTNSEKPIEDLLIHYNQKKKTFFIGKKDNKEKLLKNTILTKYSHLLNEDKSTVKTKTSTVKITKVKIEVDKNSKDENLKKESEFLAEKGVKVRFKNIKRNVADEITGIKVSYDNGAGDTGVYQKKKNIPINPFVVTVSFKDVDTPKITVSEVGSSKNNVVSIYSNDSDDFIWTSANTKNKTIEVKKEGDTNAIYLDGKKVSIEELSEENKFIGTSIQIITNDSIDENTVIDKLRYSDENNNEEIIRVKSGGKENIFIIDSSKSDSYSKKIELKGTSSKRPLLIIDGKISNVDIESIDSDGIESMSVFKGKSATKRYGKKGKNGVVEIITKKK